MAKRKLGPIINEKREELEKRHYIRKAGSISRWVDFSKGELKKYREKNGDAFCIIVFDPLADAYVIPFERVKNVLTDVSVFDNRGRVSGNITKKNKLSISGATSIDISDCQNNSDYLKDEISEKSLMEGFEWVPLYKEIARKAISYRDRQKDLIGIIRYANDNITKEFDSLKGIKIEDRPAKGQTAPLEDMDPFTFFASFNRYPSFKPRKRYLQLISEKLRVESAVPDVFLGVPTVQPQSSWFFGFKYLQPNRDLDPLWDLAEKVVQEGPREITDPLFEKCLNLRTVGLSKLTQCMFCMNPEKFLPFDQNVRTYLQDKGIATEIAAKLKRDQKYSDYLSFLSAVRENMPDSFFLISHYAYEFSKNKGDVEEENEDDEIVALPKDAMDYRASISVEELRNKFSLNVSDSHLHFPPDMQRDLNIQINTALKSGKHIILIGPPGTGKSKLAKFICEQYRKKNFFTTTATSDWTTYDTIGGLMPEQGSAGDTLIFKPGLFLDCFRHEGKPVNRWLIIDEINRADIDKAFGALFSVLAGDAIKLAYNINGKRIEIRPQQSDADGLQEEYERMESQSHMYVVPEDWRLIATMNTFDKTSLYEMSYAFMRRFAFIPVGVPVIGALKDEDWRKYCEIWKTGVDSDYLEKLKIYWSIVNDSRAIGPAVARDLLEYVHRSRGDWASALIMYVFPQFEGLLEKDQTAFIKKIVRELPEGDRERVIGHASDFFGIMEQEINGPDKEGQD